jgi:hypothetical protein
VNNNKVIASSATNGKPILHWTGDGFEYDLPDDISNGSDFYIIYMDPASEASNVRSGDALVVVLSSESS